MAIVKMVTMNIVGLKEYSTSVSREIVLMENVDIINALNEINESHFTLSVTEENVDELVGMSMLRPLLNSWDHEDIFEKIRSLEEIYKEEFTINNKYITKSCNLCDCSRDINILYNKLMGPYKNIKQLEKEIERTEEFYKNFQLIKNLDVKIENLRGLEFFTYTFGVLSKDNINRMKKNYENITAIVLHTGSSDTGEVYLVISPKELELETNRILRSLNFQNIQMNDELVGTPTEVIENLECRKEEVKQELNLQYQQFQILKSESKEQVEECYSKLKLHQRIKEVETQMVISNNFFYLSGWVPEKDKERIKDRLQLYSDLIISFKGQDEMESDFNPPTKLRNHAVIKPFEYLVKMYGIPSYTELDPTAFLSITYMFLFGAMFGDVGQGFILFLAGILLKSKSQALGGILNRLGFSSIVFGFFYGSVFGFEHIIRPLLLNPFESRNTILIAAVVIGIVLLIISYIYSMINATKQKDLKEGLFGRNGATGLAFYIILLILAGKWIGIIEVIPTVIIVIMIIPLIAFMILKEPLSNLILNRRPLYHESPSSYYIESIFDFAETLLNMLSGTISFIRVGAFALTHVGLFKAFETIAELLNNPISSIIVLVLGNIIIVGLEGLIVFIQGLRLEYYELFSKYYRGEGVEFNPITLNDKS